MIIVVMMIMIVINSSSSYFSCFYSYPVTRLLLNCYSIVITGLWCVQVWRVSRASSPLLRPSLRFPVFTPLLSLSTQQALISTSIRLSWGVYVCMHAFAYGLCAPAYSWDCSVLSLRSGVYRSIPTNRLRHNLPHMLMSVLVLAPRLSVMLLTTWALRHVWLVQPTLRQRVRTYGCTVSCTKINPDGARHLHAFKLSNCSLNCGHVWLVRESTCSCICYHTCITFDHNSVSGANTTEPSNAAVAKVVASVVAAPKAVKGELNVLY